jgi:hypothetical protein
MANRQLATNSWALREALWAHNLLKITHTCHTLQSSHVLGTLASKIASQVALKAPPQVVISKRVSIRP